MAVESRNIRFKNRDISVAGVIHLPDGFVDGGCYPALVIVTPGSSVKEQIGEIWGRKLAHRGYVALAFDPCFQGESGGEPRDLEDPAGRVEDVRCAVDFLMAQPYIGEDQVGVLGICAGGGYAVNAAMTEPRFKAVGTVVAVNIGRARRQSSLFADAVINTLEAVGRQRTAEARGGKAKYEAWIPETVEQAKSSGITDRDTLDAVSFYSERHPRATRSNRRNVLSLGPLMAFDAFHLVGELLTQPLQIIVAGRLGTTFQYEDGKLLFEKAKNKKDLVVIDGAGHYDLYDNDQYIDEALNTLCAFYRQYLLA